MLLIAGLVGCNPDAKRLYDDLLSNYNRLIRPVPNNTQKLTVRLGLKLSQLIDVNLKDQVMTTNVWVEQVRQCCQSSNCYLRQLQLLKRLWPDCVNAVGKLRQKMLSYSSNKIHKSWARPFSQALQMCFL